MAPEPSLPAAPGRWRRVALGLAVALAAAGTGLVLALDTLLTGRARAVAADLSASLRRPVEVGRVSVSVLHGLAAEVSGVEVGPASGEPAPLLRLGRAEVRVDAWRVLATLGKEVPVRSATADGLELAVLALPDGGTNLEQVLGALAGPPEASPAAPAPPADRSAVRVDHLALTGGRVSLTDLRPGAAPPVEVHALALTVDGLQAGRPLSATLSAAALAPTPNLEVRLRTAPLPASLVPVVEALDVKLQPLDLAPLAPFFPRTVGVRGGRVDADLQLRPGGAAPGGSGPSTLKGVVHAVGLRFADAAGARPVDATLDADVSADVAAGDVTLTRLELRAGGASLTGTGKVLGLLGASPRAEAFSLLGKDLDPQLLTASFPALARLLPGEVAGPVGLVLVASGTEARPSVSLQLELTPVRLALPGQLAKAAGAPARLVGTVRGQGGGSLGFEGYLELTGADLRPGGLLDKGPGGRLTLAASGSVHPGAPFQVTVARYQAQLLDDELSGEASVSRAAGGRLQAAATVRGARLDLDRLLLHGDAPEAEAPPPAPAAGAAGGPTAGVEAKLELALGALRSNGLEATRLAATASLAQGVLTLQHCGFTAAGGAFTLDGTTVTLAQPARPFSARVKLEHLDVQQALQVLWPEHRVVEGRFDGALAFTGSQRALTSTLGGQLDGTLHDGTFVSVDAVGAAVGPLLSKLPFMQGLVPGRPGGAGTALGTVPVGLTVKDGTALLKAPLVIRTPEAVVTFSGGAGLDGTLRLPTRVELTPALISRVTLGKAAVTAPVPVGFTLTGPAWKPQVTELDLAPAVTTLVGAAAGGAIGGAVGRVVGGLGTLLGGGAAPAPAPADAGTPPPGLEDQAAKALKQLLGR